MKRKQLNVGIRTIFVLTVLLVLTASFIAEASNNELYANKRSEAYRQLKSETPDVKSYKTGSHITRLYGKPMGYGTSPEVVAESFITEHADVFGVERNDLVKESLLEDKAASRQIMYNSETGEYKFTLVYYAQYRDGVPVYNSEVRLLVRNEVGYPLVLVVSKLHDLEGFVPDKSYVGGVSSIAFESARRDEPDLTDFSEQKSVIWAGTNDKEEQPRTAVTFIGSSDFPQKFEFVVDAATGEILHKQDLIIFEDVVGNVSGMVTPGAKAMQCTEEVLVPFPYAYVNVESGNSVYTDVNGDFTIPHAGTTPVNVLSPIIGLYFEVFNYSGSEDDLSQTVTPPGPANFIHNEANTQEHVIAQANGYANANEVRDFALAQNPSYPVIHNQTGFSVYVNRTDGYCPGNAWYDGSSINFCVSSSTYGNTAFASVSQHEYGHHLIASGGSGQGQYGEGMADCVAMLISDDPGLGYGFYFDQCDTPLRNADNSYQYPCTGGIHDCGQLLSGCVWDTREQLSITEPVNYRAVLANLTINSILLHTGTEITPQITIDFLTLDDDDGDIGNGSPHYYEIASAFGLHNMDAPELDLLAFEYPDNTPTMLAPNLPTSFGVNITGVGSEEPVPGTGKLHYSVNGGNYIEISMTENNDNEYTATIPAFPCNTIISYFFSAQSLSGQTEYDPSLGSAFNAVVATAQIIAFEDDFETYKSWVISGGYWGRGVPTGGGGEYGGPDPTSGHNAPNVFGYNLSGDYENSMPERHLTSPAIDCSALTNTHLKFWRWLGVEQPTYDHAYIRISNDGTNWTTIWENSGEISDNSWIEVEYDISAYADGEPIVYIRFTMGSTDSGWRYCGWNIDDLQVSAFECLEDVDTDEDGVMDYEDNCPTIPNPGQEDADADNVGNVCDNCEFISNPNQVDADLDGIGDLCDNCPAVPNADQLDDDSDGNGNLCDICPGFDDYADSDADAVPDGCDNCPDTSNAGQEDADYDGVGDLCDNCINTSNPQQEDTNEDGRGDACCCLGIKGNIDEDPADEINIADLVYFVEYSFGEPIGPAPTCFTEADVDGSQDLDIADIVYIVAYMFDSGPAPTGCYLH